MERRRLAMKVFLFVHYDTPIEPPLTPEEYENFAEALQLANAAAAQAPPRPHRSPPRGFKKKFPDSKRKKIIKIKRQVIPPPPEPPLPLPTEYNDLVARKKGGEVRLISAKRLSATDTSAHHDRVTMTRGQMKEEFLTPREEVLVGGSQLDVRVFDPSGEERQMYLATWNGVYALHHGWKNVVGSNHLEAGDAIQVWSFRIDRSLCLLIHKTDSWASGSS